MPVPFDDRTSSLFEAAERDRRVHARRVAAEVPWLTKLRLLPGPMLSLVDLSAGGMQVEIENFRLRPGWPVVVEIADHQTELVVPSRVVRCHVSSIAPSILYRGALVFRQPLALSDLSSAAAGPQHRDPSPLIEHARLALALRAAEVTLGDEPRVLSCDGTEADGLTAVGAVAMAATLALIDSPASRRAGATFARQLALLLREMTRAVEGRDSVLPLTFRIEEQLRRVIPARSIRVADGALPEAPLGPDVIYFETAGVNGRSSAKLLVEFARGSRPLEWQFQLLKAAAHLVTLARHLDDRRRSAAEAARRSATAEVPAGWARLVVR